MSTVGGPAARRAAHRDRCPAIGYNPNPKPKPKPKPNPKPRISQVPSGVQEISFDELTLTEGEAVGLTEAQQAGDVRRYTEM